MNRMCVGKSVLLAVGVVITSLLGVHPATAEVALAGHHHSDPAHAAAMPESWGQQAIQYKDIPAGSDLAITLDQQLYPALLPMIKEFARERQLKIAVQEGTCGISSGALIDKKVDMAGFCCPAAAGDRLPGLSFHTLGIGAIALLKNRENPTPDISSAMARKVYHGEISSWEEVNGQVASLPSLGYIDSTARLHCKNRPGHWRLILDNEDLFSPTVTEVSTIEDMLARVERSPNALGYETLWMVARFGSGKAQTLMVDGVDPHDDEALAAGRYPFYRTFNITSWSDPKLARGEVQDLIAYIKANFHRVEKEFGFISAARLRQAGWTFAGDELLSPPSP